MIDVKEILDKHGAYWVSKFDGKKSIDCENAKEAIKEIIESVLLEASNSGYSLDWRNAKCEIHKESITSVINKVKF